MILTNQFIRSGLLENIDMFGININIRFNKQVYHKTKIGGMFTIIIFFLLCVQIYLIAQNLLDSQNPTVLYQQSFTTFPERFDINPKTFSLAFGLQDPKSQHYYDPSIYKITLWLKKTKKVLNEQTHDYTTKWDERVVKLEQCTKDHFQAESSQNYFLNLKFSSLFCISRQETDIYIEGQFDANSYSGLQIIVESCTPGSKDDNGNDIICKSALEINKKLNNGRLAVYYTDNAIVTRDRDNPFLSIGRQSFWVSGPEFSKSLNISFRNSYLYTDIGLVTTEIEKQRALTFSFDREQTTPKIGNILYDCYISFEKNMNSEYHRSYPKLDKALSQLGGIYNLLFAIGCLLCKPISLIEFNRKLINSLFSFEDTQDNSQNNSKDKENDSYKNTFTNQIKQSGTLQQLSNPDFRDICNDQTQNFHSQCKNIQIDSKPNLTIKESFVQLNLDIKKQKSITDFPQTYPKNQMKPLKNFTRNSFLQITQKQLDDQITHNTENKSQQTLSLKCNKINAISTKLKPVNSQAQIYQQEKTKIKEQNISKEDADQTSIFIQTFNQIRFKSWEYFMSYFNVFSCWRTKKYNVIKEGVDKLYNHIDIFYITNKLIEVEKLKHLLLNENQLKLFEFMPKPVLSSESKLNTSDKTNSINILYEDKRSVLEKAQDAQKAFNALLSSSHKMSAKDKRLIELLHPKFKNYIEDAIESEIDITDEIQNIQKNVVRNSILTHPFNKVNPQQLRI